MLRDYFLIIAFLLFGQLAVGQNYIYGDYKGTQVIVDSIRYNIHLSLKKDGQYIMKYPRRDSIITLNGKWRQTGNKVKLTSKYSRDDKRNGLERTFVLVIEGDRLIWKPFEKGNSKLERQMSKDVGEKVTLTVMKSEPIIFNKEN